MTADKKEKNLGMKIIQSILSFLMVSIFVLFILGEIYIHEEKALIGENCRLFEAEWMRILPDGSSEMIEVPGKCIAERGEWVAIETTLPHNQEDTGLAIRSLQQDIRIYVDGELRKEYSTIASQPFGKTSTIGYIFFEIKAEDAGKVLRLEMMSDSSHSGVVSELYEGTQSEIWKHLMGLYAPATLVAALMLLVGIVVVLISLAIRFFYRTEGGVLYLGNVIILAATWLIVESRLRQFILPNSTIAMYMGFLTIMLLPYPVSAYMNRAQKCRYQKAYMVIEILTIVNFIISTWLQVCNIKDFFETMWAAHAILVGVIGVLATTIFTDIRKGYVREYQEIAIGIGGLMLAGVCEIYLVYVQNAHFNGIALCLSLIFLLTMSCVRAIKNILQSEQEKQLAITASESKAKFLANMSHEIRTPINTVIGMNEMILRENQDEHIREYACSIKSASQMLLSLINDILDFSKIEAGKLQLTESEYELAFMLKDVILGIENRVRKKNLELKLEIDETMPSVLLGDEVRIKQIFNNLLSNAIKYTEKGNVTLSVKGVRENEDFSLLVSIADTGIGIRREDMERLFDSFQRLELQKNRYIEGSGLGLNITRQLTEIMNGRIEVESEYGKGSCFRVWLPQKIVKDVPMGRLEQNVKRADTGSGSAYILYAPDAKILAVDDNPMNLKVIGGLLRRSQIQMEFAAGGNECLEMTRKKKYDLILMDHMMPEPDGIQTLRMLRAEKDNCNRDTKVIALTANVIAGIEEEYRKEGFADYLSKPVKVERLEEVLAEHLGEKAKRR